jgi:hypothetical protein
MIQFLEKCILGLVLAIIAGSIDEYPEGPMPHAASDLVQRLGTYLIKPSAGQAPRLAYFKVTVE